MSIRKIISHTVNFVSTALKVRVFVGVKVEMRREREASLKGAMHPRAYSTMAHGLCCVLPQASASIPPFATILFPLFVASFSTLSPFDESVELLSNNRNLMMKFQQN